MALHKQTLQLLPVVKVIILSVAPVPVVVRSDHLQAVTSTKGWLRAGGAHAQIKQCPVGIPPAQLKRSVDFPGAL